MTKRIYIPLAEAFRRLLRAGYPARPTLANEISSYSWFYVRQVLVETKKASNEETAEYDAAKRAADQLRAAIIAEDLALRGVFKSDKPADIDPADCAAAGVGGIDFLGNILEVSKAGKTERRYEHVRCKAADIAKLIKPRPAARRLKISETKCRAAVGNYLRATGRAATQRGLLTFLTGLGIEGPRAQFLKELKGQRGDVKLGRRSNLEMRQK